MTALRVAVLCVATLTCACGEDRLIGVTCGPDDCAAPRDSGDEPPPCLQLTLPFKDVQPGDRTMERCVVFSLDDLQVLGDTPYAFLNEIRVESTPSPHDLDLRIAAEAPTELGSREYACTELLALAIPWAPVLVTDRPNGNVDFGQAPLVVSRAHHLLVIDSFTNLTASTAQAGVTVNLYCKDTVPDTASQAFEMTKRGIVTVPPAGDVTVSANCTFQKDLLVSRLYRRTRSIRVFTVGRINGESLWRSELDYRRDFDPPLAFETGQGLEWTCRYINDTDINLDVGGTSTDPCALFGLYSLPDGSPDPSPEHCVL